MPELPEVETTRRGILPYLENQRIRRVVIRDHRLRWPICVSLPAILKNQTIHTVSRRGKYLLLDVTNGTLIVHLGMSGSLRISEPGQEVGRWDHFELQLSNGTCLRLRDPRRFGAILWTEQDPNEHPRIRNLGPEPLTTEFSGDYLHQRARGRRCSVKSLIMSAGIVVGIGNIYACESLYLSGIHPRRQARRISRARYQVLANSIKQVLTAAIDAGGTTLKDFVSGIGQPGYFSQQLQVYGRAGLACNTCSRPIQRVVQQQRSSFYCTRCQH